VLERPHVAGKLDLAICYPRRRGPAPRVGAVVCFLLEKLARQPALQSSNAGRLTIETRKRQLLRSAIFARFARRRELSIAFAAKTAGSCTRRVRRMSGPPDSSDCSAPFRNFAVDRNCLSANVLRPIPLLCPRCLKADVTLSLASWRTGEVGHSKSVGDFARNAQSFDPHLNVLVPRRSGNRIAVGNVR
jgi:hypothetical protein